MRQRTLHLRERKFYYVDKANSIPRLGNYNAPVFLCPRRFGKSLLVSTPACYYDHTKTDRFEESFGGTWIGEHPTEEHSYYIVVRYGFSAIVMANDIEELGRNFNLLSYSPAEIMIIRNRDLPQDSQSTIKSSASQMLEEVPGYARGHGLLKVYILIDKYNNFTNQLLTAHEDPLHE